VNVEGSENAVNPPPVMKSVVLKNESDVFNLEMSWLCFKGEGDDGDIEGV
jgi:hypothetical protein